MSPDTRARNRGGRPSELAACNARWVARAEHILAEVTAKAEFTWPALTYREFPVQFAQDILGVTPWNPRQVEVLEAVRDHKRVAIASGHKVSKSHTAAIIALWFYCSFPDARVVMTSTTDRQVNAILWREIRKMHRFAKVPIGGTPAQRADTGLKSDDFREIVGFTAREAEAVAGISGKNLLYILDEATGIPDVIFEAIEGNRAGGARLVMFSNPTRTDGEFADAFLDEKKSKFYHTIRISSEESPNVVQGREVIEGLATKEWIDEKREEWGEDSPLYKVRVKGEFVVGEDGKIVTLHAIGLAEQRWYDAPAVGRLHLGLDPAGPGEGGDETAIALRRGQKILSLVTHRGLTEEAHVAHVLGALREHRRDREDAPIVAVDCEGPIGARVYGLLAAHADRHPDAFEVLRIRSSDRAIREPRNYDRVRDELWANLAAWLREGGAIVEDKKLAKELHTPEWTQHITGRLKVTDKRELRKILGRSPDRADAVALAVWEPISMPSDDAEKRADAEPDDVPEDAAIDRVFDPYAGV